MPTTDRRPRTQLRVVELEGRYAPAVFDVTFHGPADGIAGETAATHAGGLALTGGTPQGADTARVMAATAADAVRAVLSGAVTATLDGKTTTYTFGTTTASGDRADRKPFFVSLPDGRTGFVRLEDMAGSPNTADWDYNDRAWRVGVRPVGGPTVGGGGPQPQGGDPSGGDPPYPPPPPPPPPPTPPDPIVGDATLYDFYDQSATVAWEITFPAPDTMHWRYTVTNNSIHNVTLGTNKGMTSFTVGGPPADFRYTDTSLTPWHKDPAVPAWNWPGTGGLMPPGVGVFEFDTDWQPAEMVEAGAGGTGRYMTLALGMVMGPAPKPTVSIQTPRLVAINADNDNWKPPPAGSPDMEAGRWKPAPQKYIPVTRDYSTSNLWQADNELAEVMVTVTGGLAGTLFVEDYAPGEGQITFWEDNKKVKAFSSVQLTPAAGQMSQTVKLYVEGLFPSQSEDDVFARARFTPNIAPGVEATAEKALTVGPFLTDLTAVGAAVRFVNGVDGRNGLVGGKFAPAPAIPGMTLTATAFNGAPVAQGGVGVSFISNVTNVQNRANGSAAGAVDANPAQNKNVLPNPGSGIVMPGAVLDSVNAANPLMGTTVLGQTQTHITVQATDTPELPPPPGQGGTVNTYDVKKHYKTWVVVQFPDESLYSLGEVVWDLNYYATRSKNAVGLWADTVDVASKFTVTSITENHDDILATMAPIANGNFSWQ